MDLEQDVAQLVEQLGVVAAVGRVGELVGLLDGVRHDRPLVLLAVPRALDPQAPRQLVEPADRVADGVGQGCVCGGGCWPGAGAGCVCCGTAPGGTVDPVVLGFGAFLQSCVT